MQNHLQIRGGPGRLLSSDFRSGRKIPSMAIAARGSSVSRNVCWASLLAVVLAVGCTRKEAPALAPAAAPAPPSPPAPVVRDAASDVGDAATDAADAGGG